ncbi:hypothetical protein BO223_06440 [Faecalibaculum rodentium]|uniref:Uncharacterized protein n=2 Tax=Faecalibaculum rodentium TaxID=1702221 RepID=A0A1Q9YK68_9FIRM|nr:hypothetical protein BO223_06440 [Faecalibaculum rodentium]
MDTAGNHDTLWLKQERSGKENDMELLLIIGFLYVVYAMAGSGSGYDDSDSQDDGLTDWEEGYTIWRMTKRNRKRRHNRKK